MSPPALPLADAADVVRFVGRGSFERGRDYFRNGAVTDLSWDPTVNRLTGTVSGSEALPYRCTVTLIPSSSKRGFHRPVFSECSCAITGDCKHVAATILSCNAAHLLAIGQHATGAESPAPTPAPTPPKRGGRTPSSAAILESARQHRADNPRRAEAPPVRSENGMRIPSAPEPIDVVARKAGWVEASAPPVAGWKTVLGALSSVGDLSDDEADVIGGQPARKRPTTPMALQFELRTESHEPHDRWRRPKTQPVADFRTDAGDEPRWLGVRPVVRSSAGAWVRANVTWSSFAHQVNRLNLSPGQNRWFSQFTAVYRATRGAQTSQDADWIYLDSFLSPLFWHLLADAERLEIPFVGVKKETQVRVGTSARLFLDATLAPGIRGAQATRSTPMTLSTDVQLDGVSRPITTVGTIGNHGLYSVEPGRPLAITLAPTSGPISAEHRRLLAQTEPLIVPSTDIAEFFAVYLPRLRGVVEVKSSDASVTIPEVVEPALILIATFAPKHTLSLEWLWQYGAEPRLPIHASATDAALRDAGLEQQVLKRVAEKLRDVEGIPGSDPTMHLRKRLELRDFDAVEFTEKVLPLLEELPGVTIEIVGKRADYHELTDIPHLAVSTVETDKRDWFDLGVNVTVDGRTVPFGPLFEALSKGKKRLLLIDNSYLSLQQPVFEPLRQLIEEAQGLAEWETGVPRISRYQAGLWADFEDLADESAPAVAWRDSVSALIAPDGIAPVPLPESVQATLRPYQRDGFSWLAFLWKNRLGGVLADDMGLGKTLQTLALIAYALEQKAAERAAAGHDTTADHDAAAQDAAAGEGAEETPSENPAPEHPAAHRPFLVVAPTSVVSNWAAEAARFVPHLVTRTITATQAKTRSPVAEFVVGADIIVTSYALFRLDFEAFQNESWAGLILDEAQFTKNRASRIHHCAREFAAPVKFAITGTPMENDLMELWALFAIVAPGLFPSARRFTEEYVRPIDFEQNTVLIDRLRRRIRPLMMRRSKELVATELPEKQEQVLKIDLDPEHRTLYDTFLQRERQKLLGLIDDLDKNRFIVFRSLTLLRMLSLDASLVDEKYSHIPSSKLDALLEQLDDVVAEGHRALVFSQFTSFLRRAAARLDEQGIPYAYLDGSSRNRPEIISTFKNGSAPVFLISLKAGGVGLNLTEADYVFLLDPWWNPATEAQAIDRSHRIGQTKRVLVYRMVATDTIEEKVMALKERKAALTDAVLDDEGAFSSSLTADDIRGLFGGA